MIDFNSIMGKVQEAQARMQKAQENLANITETAEMGAGMVQVTVNGKKQIIDINIDPEIISADNKEMIQDLIIAATNKALENIDPKIKAELQNSTSDLIPNIPGFDISNFMK